MFRHASRWSFVLLLLCVPSLLLAQKERKLVISAAEKKVALILGNWKYQNATALVNPENDSNDMAKVLKKDGFDVIARQNLTRNELYKALREFSEKLKDASVGLFYYSGHGVQAKGTNYLIPVTGNIQEEDDLKYLAVPAQEPLNRMIKAKCRLSIMILDACRYNPFPEKVRGVTRGGLASMSASGETLVMYATGENDTANDNPQGRNGLFTQELLSHMQIPGLKLLDVFNQTSQGVLEKSKKIGKLQRPFLYLGPTSDFYFVPPLPSFYFSSLTVDSIPSGAAVVLDNRVIGRTPIKDFRLELGGNKEKQFSLAMALPPKYKGVETSFTAQADKPVLLEPMGLEQTDDGIRPVETKLNKKDEAEMVFVPAGEFDMGSTEGKSDEKPVHKVHLDGFWIYRSLVSVGMYQRYCQITGRKMPAPPKWGWSDDDPMVNLSWQEAKSYCDWAGGQLPTEAQWEKAARGVEGYIYPWGNVFDPRLCNGAKLGKMRPVRVGSFRRGQSPYGALDMAGNVWQWCSDWYEADYYAKSGNNNPQGPRGNEFRVVRGGGFDSDEVSLRSSNRSKMQAKDNKDRYDTVGFRMVKRN